MKSSLNKKMKIIIQLVITQYIEIKMYNIHAHIEKRRKKNIEKYSNGKKTKKKHITNFIFQIRLTIHTNI